MLPASAVAPASTGRITAVWAGERGEPVSTTLQLSEIGITYHPPRLIPGQKPDRRSNVPACAFCFEDTAVSAGGASGVGHAGGVHHGGVDHAGADAVYADAGGAVVDGHGAGHVLRSKRLSERTEWRMEGRGKGKNRKGGGRTTMAPLEVG